MGDTLRRIKGGGNGVPAGTRSDRKRLLASSSRTQRRPMPRDFLQPSADPLVLYPFRFRDPVTDQWVRGTRRGVPRLPRGMRRGCYAGRRRFAGALVACSLRGTATTDLPMSEILGLLVLVGGGWFVWDILRAREAANAAMRNAQDERAAVSR